MAQILKEIHPVIIDYETDSFLHKELVLTNHRSPAFRPIFIEPKNITPYFEFSFNIMKILTEFNIERIDEDFIKIDKNLILSYDNYINELLLKKSDNFYINENWKRLTINFKGIKFINNFVEVWFKEKLWLFPNGHRPWWFLMDTEISSSINYKLKEEYKKKQLLQNFKDNKKKYFL